MGTGSIVQFVRFSGPIVRWGFAALISGFAAQSAQADLFSSLFSSAPVAQVEDLSLQEQTRTVATAENGAICIAAILEAQARHGIPDNLLLAIGIQEAGRTGPDGLAVWPWTVNANGEGAFFKNRQDAQDWVRVKQAEGIHSIDVGCMQVNLRWHGEQFPHQDAAFDPNMNADYAARFLLSLYQETGSWTKAAGRYHSATEQYQARYLASLARNQKVVAKDFPRLAAMAARFGAVQVAQAQTVAAPSVPTPTVFWGGVEGQSFSIYSNTPIQPILPSYREAN